MVSEDGLKRLRDTIFEDPRRRDILQKAEEYARSLEDEEYKLVILCYKHSSNLDKCPLCEFRFKCYTIREEKR